MVLERNAFFNNIDQRYDLAVLVANLDVHLKALVRGDGLVYINVRCLKRH